MSDQEPVGKRMLGQLRDHTEPYLPDAWEHFERFRATQSRKKRMILYGLSATAFLVILGTALVTNQVMDRARPVKYSVAQKPTNGTQPGQFETRPTDGAAMEQLSPPAKALKQPLKSRNEDFQQEHQKIRAAAPQASTAPQSPDYLPRASAGERTSDSLSPDFLFPRPFDFPVPRFGKLDISLPEPQIQTSRQSARAIRWGVAVLQQSNRAAHTNPDLNYGFGGALLVPLSNKIAWVTGISGSKQSLNVEEPARLNAAQGAAQLQRVRYHWVNLEIPFQIQYKLRTFKNIGFTAAGGIALQTSLGQAADYHYKTTRTIATFAETAGGPVLVSTQTIEELSSVTRNDKKNEWTVGTPLYFGLGISYQWEKTTVEIEPYVKYPLGTSTADRLQLTTMGIQLRLTGALRKVVRPPIFPPAQVQ